MTKNDEKTTKQSGIEKRMENLKKGKRFSSTNQPANRGRLPKWVNTIKSIPPDAQEKIYARLYEAMLCASKDDAIAILNAKGDELGDYGFVLQVAARALSGKDGMGALSQILERIFGKPVQPSIDIGDSDKKDAFIKGVFIP